MALILLVLLFFKIHRVATLSGNSGNFQVEDNLWETEGESGNFDYFFQLGQFWFLSSPSDKKGNPKQIHCLFNINTFKDYIKLRTQLK